MKVPHIPGRRTINYGVGPHRCPLCNHSCYLTQPPKSSQPGRPPESRDKMIALLRASPTPVQPIDLAKKLKVSRSTINKMIYRSRRLGYVITYTFGDGYWLSEEQPVPQKTRGRRA